MGHRIRQGRDAHDAPTRQGGGSVLRRFDRREHRLSARDGAPRGRPGGTARDRVVRHRRALSLEGLQRRVVAGERDPGERAGDRSAPPRREERHGRAAARFRGAERHGPPGAEPDEHVQRVAAAGARRWGRRGRRVRARADGESAGRPLAPRSAGRGPDGSALPGRGRRCPGRPAQRVALPRDARRPGAPGGEARRHRDPLRSAASAGRDPLMRITVLTGGASAERTVAFAGAAQIVEALRGRGHKVEVVDTVTGLLSPGDEGQLLTGAVGREPPSVAELDAREREFLSDGLSQLDAVKGADVLLLCLHAGRGEGGTLQAILDVIGAPYTGSGAMASALAMDKDLSKRLFRAAGVPVPAWFMAPVAPEDVTTALGWPVIVKPSKMGSSVGMTLVRNPEGLDAAVEVARAFDTEVMAEQFIPGRELTVGVLGDVPLPVGEIIPKHELFDYECKYTPGMSEELFPATLDTALARQLQELALTAHRALKLGGYSRVDFRLSPEGDIFCLEANTLPGMTRTSLLPQAARAAGIEFPELCERICRLAGGGNSGSARGG